MRRVVGGSRASNAAIGEASHYRRLRRVVGGSHASNAAIGEASHYRRLGRVVGGDAGVVTQREPDSVRGPDVAFYSYQRIPRGPLPEGYWPASPELVIEIRSKDDRWKDIHQKIGEYFSADVLTVAVVDSEQQRVYLFSADRETAVLNSSDQLTFPDILPGFEIVVARLFD